MKSLVVNTNTPLASSAPQVVPSPSRSPQLVASSLKALHAEELPSSFGPHSPKATVSPAVLASLPTPQLPPQKNHSKPDLWDSDASTPTGSPGRPPRPGSSPLAKAWDPKSATPTSRRLNRPAPGGSPLAAVRSRRAEKKNEMGLTTMSQPTTPAFESRSLSRGSPAASLRPLSRSRVVSPASSTRSLRPASCGGSRLFSPVSSPSLPSRDIVNVEVYDPYAAASTKFSEPSHRGVPRVSSAVFPRALREIHKPMSEDSGDVAQALVGGVGAESVPISTLRRAPSVRMAQATREAELRRIRAPDTAADRHGPADYNQDDKPLRRAVSSARIGTARRQFLERESVGPGPGQLLPKSTLRENRATHFGSAPRVAKTVDAPLPGPGSYATEKPAPVGHLRTKAPAAQFGTAKREGITPKDALSTPGPAGYDSAKSVFVTGGGRRQPAFRFSTAKRF